MSRFANSWKTWTAGYLLFLIVALGILGTVYVLTWRDSVADKYSRFTEQALEYLDLNAEARVEIVEIAAGVLEEFRAETLDDEGLQRLLISLQKSPLASVLVFVPILESHVKVSGFSADEKKTAERDVRRLCRGLLDESVDPDADLPAVLKAVPRVADDPDRMNFEIPMTDETLRALFAGLSGLLKEKRVSEDDDAGDVLGEVQRIADASGLRR